ncbi:MAG: response regulator transcription factor [Bacteroidia bacterium]|nr:response regulator transcription factor [Bacteroidia bacterium]
MEKIKIMIAEDHPIYRNALVEELSIDNIEIIGAAENGQVLVDMVKKHIPDIVILDLKMPVLEGSEVLKIFAKDFPSIRTIVLSQDYSDFLAADAVVNGVSAYLSKNHGVPELIKAINSVYSHRFYFNEIISKEILEQLTNDKKKLYYLIENVKFSEKEIELLKHLGEGLSLSQIAAKMNISQNTVNSHKKNLFNKTESDNIVLLIKFAIRQGIAKG